MWTVIAIIILIVLLGGEKLGKVAAQQTLREKREYDTEHEKEIYMNRIISGGLDEVDFLGNRYTSTEVLEMLDRIEQGLFPIGDVKDLPWYERCDENGNLKRNYLPLEQVEDYIKNNQKPYYKGKGYDCEEERIKEKYREVLYRGKVVIGKRYDDIHEMTVDEARQFIYQNRENMWEEQKKYRANKAAQMQNNGR